MGLLEFYQPSGAASRMYSILVPDSQLLHVKFTRPLLEIGGGLLIIETLLFGICIRAHDFAKLPFSESGVDSLISLLCQNCQRISQA